VFSTVHTNDAAGGITRLIDMGIEPFLVASSLVGLLAQRLVRRPVLRVRAPGAGPASWWSASSASIPIASTPVATSRPR
jgi:type II secretory ATPase GspE/PulE/Tfp pilus assembly ATPase PilB-like protein